MEMNGSVVAYLAGKVPKGDEIGRIADWRQSYIKALSTVANFEFLSPDDPTLDESQPEQIFGHDCYLVTQCDVLVVNAASKLGVGTSQEMVLAKHYGKHVFTVLPRDSHHRRTDLQMHGYSVPDWIHPFVYCMSDAIFENLGELCAHVSEGGTEVLGSPPKTLAYVDGAIERYRQSSHRGVSHR